jgi:hypothetical protein
MRKEPQRRKGRKGWLVLFVLAAFLSIMAACSPKQVVDTDPEPDGPALIVFYTDN